MTQSAAFFDFFSSGYGTLIVIQGQKEDFLVEGKASTGHGETS